jgi:hypothetical protein
MLPTLVQIPPPQIYSASGLLLSGSHVCRKEGLRHRRHARLLGFILLRGMAHLPRQATHLLHLLHLPHLLRLLHHPHHPRLLLLRLCFRDSAQHASVLAAHIPPLRPSPPSPPPLLSLPPWSAYPWQRRDGAGRRGGRWGRWWGRWGLCLADPGVPRHPQNTPRDRGPGRAAIPSGRALAGQCTFHRTLSDRNLPHLIRHLNRNGCPISRFGQPLG